MAMPLNSKSIFTPPLLAPIYRRCIGAIRAPYAGVESP